MVIPGLRGSIIGGSAYQTDNLGKASVSPHRKHRGKTHHNTKRCNILYMNNTMYGNENDTSTDTKAKAISLLLHRCQDAQVPTLMLWKYSVLYRSSVGWLGGRGNTATSAEQMCFVERSCGANRTCLPAPGHFYCMFITMPCIFVSTLRALALTNKFSFTV